jgi:uncharacterized protein YsxB (DUF464 family)
MIKVWVRRDGEEITAFRVEGHAGCGAAGQDIVCAAVSALVIGAENGLREIADAVEASSSSEGRLEVELIANLDGEARIKADAMLMMMLNALEKIRVQHPNVIKIYD